MEPVQPNSVIAVWMIITDIYTWKI